MAAGCSSDGDESPGKPVAFKREAFVQGSKLLSLTLRLAGFTYGPAWTLVWPFRADGRRPS